jgi:RNA polymerase sigma factor (sigma-70 family)
MTLLEIQELGYQHYPELLAFALSLTRDEERARDLLQDSFFLLLKHREKFAVGTNFRAWAKSVIRNTFLTGYRKRKRRERIQEEYAFLPTWVDAGSINNPAESSLTAEYIMAEIEQLPDRYRRAFLLHYHGVKYRDIANWTKVPIGTAKSRVFTAKAMLRERLERRGMARGVA